MTLTLAHRVVTLLERGSTEPVVLIKTRALEELLDEPWSANEILGLAKLMIVLDEIGAKRASAKIAKALASTGAAKRSVLMMDAERRRAEARFSKFIGWSNSAGTDGEGVPLGKIHPAYTQELEKRRARR